jgi:hypothetical protein
VLTDYPEQCQIVGASLNLTTACPSSAAATCQVSCQDPQNPSQCVVLNSQLVDGSPCGEHKRESPGCSNRAAGYGGTCYSGNCHAGTFLQTAIVRHCLHSRQLTSLKCLCSGLVHIQYADSYPRFVAQQCGHGYLN